MRIGIVAGELSGDILGAGLIDAIRRHYPDCTFEGVAGPRMLAAGCDSLFPLEKLCVMGFTSILRRLPEILWLRRKLVKHFLANPVDVFIGIDYPDFNLHIEGKLKKAGIKTVHYNSPKVWAWRQGRVHKIARSIDLMLTLLPFEAAFYEKFQVPVRFVGHPLADSIPVQVDRRQARSTLRLQPHDQIVAILPGSRKMEVDYLAEPFVKAAKFCLQRHPKVKFIVPAANIKRRAEFERILRKHAPHLPLTIYDGQSQQAMAAADVVLLASGTATLEAMLLKRPMVVAYKGSKISALIVRLMAKVDMAALPNLLAGKRIVLELLQHNATPEKLGLAVSHLLEGGEMVACMLKEFTKIHQQIRCNASEQAAQAVLKLMGCELLDKNIRSPERRHEGVARVSA